VTSAVAANVDADTRLVTDKSNVYRRVGALLTGHVSVNHGIREYVSKEDPTVHTNTVERHVLDLQARHARHLSALLGQAPSPVSGRI
jgi:hypothetical protein